MTNESHRCIPAASWVEACEKIGASRETVTFLQTLSLPAPAHVELCELADHLHRVEKILLTSDPVAVPHIGDDFGPETTCKRAMEGMR